MQLKHFPTCCSFGKMRKCPKPYLVLKNPTGNLTQPSSKTLFSPIRNPNPNLLQSLEKPSIPLPTISLSLSSQNSLTQFLNSHLNPSFTSQDLLHFLKNKLHHHPKFTQFDLQIFQWAQTIDSFRHDHFTYEWMVRTLAVTHRFDDLGPTLYTVLSNPCPCADESIFSCPRVEPTFQFAINSYCRVGRLNDALNAFEKMKKSIDGKPKAILYNILINGFVRHWEHKKAVELYDKMVKDRVKPDVFTFNILISSYCRNSFLDSALNLFQEMRKSNGCDPNVVTFNTLITGFFRGKKFKEGIGIAYEMLDLGCKFSVATCEILLDGLCRVGMIAEAFDLLIDLLKKGAIPSGFDCFPVVEAICKAAEVELALRVLDELWNEGNNPSIVACTTVIEGLKNLGRIEHGFGLMERMLKEGILPDSVTFNCFLEALCDVGRTRDANRLKLLASKKGLDLDGATYGILVRGFTGEGKRAEGEVVVDEMLDRGFIPDIATYNRLMDGLCDGNKVRRQK